MLILGSMKGISVILHNIGVTSLILRQSICKPAPVSTTVIKWMNPLSSPCLYVKNLVESVCNEFKHYGDFDFVRS